jgi:hypothetical protein
LYNIKNNLEACYNSKKTLKACNINIERIKDVHVLEKKNLQNKNTYKVENLIGLKRSEKQSTNEEKRTLKSKET